MCLKANESDLKLVERFVTAHGCVTSRQVAARLNKDLRVCQHLLKTLGEANRLARLGTVGGDRRQRMAVWARPGHDGLTDDTRKQLEGESDTHPELPGDGLPLVLHLAANEWRRGGAHRDAMIAALYGPAVTERAAA